MQRAPSTGSASARFRRSEISGFMVLFYLTSKMREETSRRPFRMVASNHPLALLFDFVPPIPANYSSTKELLLSTTN